jgi:hypothetical protein
MGNLLSSFEPKESTPLVNSNITIEIKPRYWNSESNEAEEILNFSDRTTLCKKQNRNKIKKYIQEMNFYDSGEKMDISNYVKLTILDVVINKENNVVVKGKIIVNRNLKSKKTGSYKMHVEWFMEKRIEENVNLDKLLTEENYKEYMIDNLADIEFAGDVLVKTKKYDITFGKVVKMNINKDI